MRAREQNAELQHELWTPGVAAPHTHTHAHATSPAMFMTYSATATSPTPQASHALSARHGAHSPGSSETVGEQTLQRRRGVATEERLLAEMQRAAQAQRTQPPACIPLATSRVAAAAGAAAEEVVESVLAGMEGAYAHGSVPRTAGLAGDPLVSGLPPGGDDSEGQRRAEDACWSLGDSHAAAREVRLRMDRTDTVDHARAQTPSHDATEHTPQTDAEERTLL